MVGGGPPLGQQQSAGYILQTKRNQPRWRGLCGGLKRQLAQLDSPSALVTLRSQYTLLSCQRAQPSQLRGMVRGKVVHWTANSPTEIILLGRFYHWHLPTAEAPKYGWWLWTVVRQGKQIWKQREEQKQRQVSRLALCSSKYYLVQYGSP